MMMVMTIGMMVMMLVVLMIIRMMVTMCYTHCYFVCAQEVLYWFFLMAISEKMDTFIIGWRK